MIDGKAAVETCGLVVYAWCMAEPFVIVIEGLTTAPLIHASWHLDDCSFPLLFRIADGRFSGAFS